MYDIKNAAFLSIILCEANGEISIYSFKYVYRGNIINYTGMI